MFLSEQYLGDDAMDGSQVSTTLLGKLRESLFKERIFDRPLQDEQELISLSNDIRNILGLENGSLFMRYEELSTIAENSALCDAYKQGFNDGISLLKEILLGA